MAVPARSRGPTWWRNPRTRAEAIAAYLFLAPYLIITSVFTVGVLLFAIFISFHSYDLFSPWQWRGLDNYTAALTSERFLRGMYNAAWYAILVTPLQTALALFMAVLLNAPITGRRFFRTIFYAPSVTATIVVSLIFIWLYQRVGVVNYLLSLLHLPGSDLGWLQDPRGLFQILAGLAGVKIPIDLWYLQGPSVALLAIMVMSVFMAAPAFMIIFLAALQDIPGHLYEAAAIDGAVGWRCFRSITLPLLRPVIFLVVVLGTISTFQIFDQIQQMTQGGPLDTTLTPVYLIYTEALGKLGPSRMGYAAAMAFILAAIIFVFTLIQRRYIEKGSERD